VTGAPRRWLARLLNSLWAGRAESDLAREIDAHLALLEDEFRRRGQAPEEARRSARLALGGVDHAKELHRDTRGLRWLGDASADIRYTVRQMRRHPGFALVAIGTLALGIGANTAMFTLVHRVLLDTLPVRSPESLVEVGCVDANKPDDVGCETSYPGFVMFRDENDVLSGLFAFAPLSDLNVVHDGHAELATAILASGDMYDILGVSPASGRLLTTSDDTPGAPMAVVLSYGYWQRRFNRDPRVIGQTLQLNTHAAIVVGVSPERFRGVTLGGGPDVTVAIGSGGPALAGRESLTNGANWWLRMIGRRKDGVTLVQAQAGLERIYRRTVEHLLSSVRGPIAGPIREYLRRVEFRVQPAAAGGASALRRDLGRPLRILMAVVGMVLFIACANLTTLVLSRTAARQRELSVRLAIGAGRWRLARQLLTESLVLSIAGGVLGLLVARWGGATILRLASGETGLRAVDLSPDVTVLAFTSATVVVAGLILALGSVWHVMRTPAQRSLRDTAGGHAAAGLARLFIPVQVTVATVVLIGAGLLLQTFENMLHGDDGFRRQQLVSFSVRPQLVGYDGARVGTYIDAVRARLESIPGVTSVTRSVHPPGALDGSTLVEAPGFESAAPMERETGNHRVGPKVVQTWGLTLLRGRDLADVDDANAGSALVNESFARHFFGSADAVGRRFGFAGSPEHMYTIVGVVADARDRGPRLPVERVAYTYLAPAAMGFGAFAVRGHGSETALIAAIRQALREADPQVPVVDLQTMDARVQEDLRRERLLAVLGSLFGGLALLLVALGLYGLVAGAVAHRTREIAIRLALGGARRTILSMFLRQGLSLVAVGLLAGLALATMLGRFIDRDLHGVTPTDTFTYSTAVAVLVLTSAVACLLPATRASRTEPMAALRND
jgi:predicted permease